MASLQPAQEETDLDLQEAMDRQVIQSFQARDRRQVLPEQDLQDLQGDLQQVHNIPSPSGHSMLT